MATKRFELIHADSAQLPLVAFQLAGENPYDEFDVSASLAAISSARWISSTMMGTFRGAAAISAANWVGSSRRD